MHGMLLLVITGNSWPYSEAIYKKKKKKGNLFG